MTDAGDGSSVYAATGPAIKGAPEFGKRFECIDGLRGLAALAVVVGHVTHVEPLGAAAVIVFFVISGYCVTAAADAGLQAGVGMRTYMWRRIRRIYPPYLLSVAFFVCTRLARDWFAPTGNASPFDPDGTDWILNATLTQWLWLIAHPAGWPHDNPSLFVSVYWSLGYEEQFYLVVGTLAFLLPRFTHSIGAALTLLSLAWITVFPNQCFGWFVEYWPTFAIGSIVYLRLCRLTTARSRRMSELVLLTAAAVAGLVAWIRSGADGMAADNGDWWGWNGCPTHRNAFGDLTIAATFGLALVLIRYVDHWYAEFRWMSVPLGWLGAISYSLYLTHNFNLRASEAGGRLLATVIGAGGSPAWCHVLQVGVLLGIAAVFYLVAERPFLNRPLRPRRDGLKAS